MALGFRGSNVGGTNPTTTTNVAIHSAAEAGDVLLLAFTSRDHTSGNNAPTVADNDTGGNSWATASNTADRKAWLFWKRATANSASKTITISGALGSLSAVSSCFTGASSETTPFGNIAIETNASADETHAGFTPDRDGAMVFFAVYNYGNDNTVSSVSQATGGAMAQSGNHESTGGSDCATAAWYKVQTTKAATGAITWAQFNGTTYSLVAALFAKVLAAASITESPDQLAGTGQVKIAAALSKTEAADTLSATARAPVTAALSKTEAPDTLAATATFGNPVATGTANITEAADTLSSAGALAIQAALAKTEASDSVSATATAVITANLAATEAADAATGTATSQIVAALSITESADTLAATALNGAGPAVETPVEQGGLPPHLIRRIRHKQSGGYVHLAFIPRSTVQVKTDQSAELLALFSSL